MQSLEYHLHENVGSLGCAYFHKNTIYMCTCPRDIFLVFENCKFCISNLGRLKFHSGESIQFPWLMPLIQILWTLISYLIYVQNLLHKSSHHVHYLSSVTYLTKNKKLYYQRHISISEPSLVEGSHHLLLIVWRYTKKSSVWNLSTKCM